MPTTAKKRILIIDDDYESMQPLRESLQDHEYQVEMNAAEGLLTRLPNERFDLILLDQMIQSRTGMPNIHFEGVSWRRTGLEFLARLRQGQFSGPEGTFADVPVIVLSAMADPNKEEKEKYGPATSYVEKPFRLSDLIRLIEQVLKV